MSGPFNKSVKKKCPPFLPLLSFFNDPFLSFMIFFHSICSNNKQSYPACILHFYIEKKKHASVIGLYALNVHVCTLYLKGRTSIGNGCCPIHKYI